MSDVVLRELERGWRRSGSPEVEAAWLRARLRAGTLAPERLMLAARCGDVAAREAALDLRPQVQADESALTDPDARRALAEGLIALSRVEPRPFPTAESIREALVEVQVAAARGNLFDPEGERRVLGLALDALVGPPARLARSWGVLLARRDAALAEPVIRWALAL